MKETVGERKDFEIDSKPKVTTKKSLYGATLIGGLLLGATGCSPINTNNSQTDLDSPPRTQLYEDGERFQYDFLTEDICEVPYVEGEPVSRFIVEDKETFLFGLEYLEHIDSSVVSIDEPTPEETVEDMAEEKPTTLEEQLNEEVKEILALSPDLTFDQEGNLFFENEEARFVPVLLFETERSGYISFCS